MPRRTSVCAALIALGTLGAACQDDDSLYVDFRESESQPWTRLEVHSRDTLQAAVGLGADLGGIELRVPGDSMAHKVDYRLETSAMVSDEGAHLDLIGWRRGETEWTRARRTQSEGYSAPLTPGENSLPFPAFSAAELRAVVHDAGGDRWSEQLDRASSPVRIRPSALVFRIQTSAGAEVQTVILRVTIPLGG